MTIRQNPKFAYFRGAVRPYEDAVIHASSEARLAKFEVRDGTVYTAPASEGALDCITVDIVEALAAEQGIPFIRRPIERRELYFADEIALVGAVTDIAPVTNVDGFATTRNSELLARLARRYEAAVRRLVPHAGVDLSRRLYRATRINNEINAIVERGGKSVRLGSEADAVSDAARSPTGAAC